MLQPGSPLLLAGGNGRPFPANQLQVNLVAIRHQQRFDVGLVLRAERHQLREDQTLGVATWIWASSQGRTVAVFSAVA